MNLQQIAVISLVLFLGLAINACASMSNNPDKKDVDYERFNTLLELNDLSERAFVYYEYCLKNEGPVNDIFMRNFEITSDLLLNESVKTMKAPPELIVQRVMGRRRVIQQQLSEYYHSQGCQSEEASNAAAHYDAFSKMSEKQVKGLVK